MASLSDTFAPVSAWATGKKGPRARGGVGHRFPFTSAWYTHRTHTASRVIKGYLRRVRWGAGFFRRASNCSIRLRRAWLSSLPPPREPLVIGS